MLNVISQSLRLDLVNINVYAKVYQNIPPSSRDMAIFTFSEFEPRQRLGQSQMILTISCVTSCQYQCVGKILSKYSKRFKSYRHFSRTGRRQNLHKLFGDNLKCLIIGHSMKFNFKFQLTFLGSAIIRYKRTGYNINVLYDRLHALSRLTSLLSSLIARRRLGLRLNEGSGLTTVN